MFGRILLTTAFATLLAFPARAAVGLILPDSPSVDDPDKTSLSLVLGAIEPSTGAGIPLERPQIFTALRHSGEEVDRSEHLSVLEEVQAFGGRAWRTDIALPHPGVYHFIMQTKAAWVPEADAFVQYHVKMQVPAYGSSEGWDKPTGMSFEIAPLSRPFGLCSGMSFTGQALFDGKPLPGATIEATRLDPALKPNVREPEDPELAEEQASAKDKKPVRQALPQPISAFGDVQQIKADAQGVFTFACPLPGWWAFSASMTGDPLQDPDGKQKPLEIKTLFWTYISDCKPPKSGGKK